MGRRQRVGIVPLLILSTLLSGVWMITNQKGGTNASVVVASSTFRGNSTDALLHVIRREKEAASRSYQRHALKLRRIAEAKAREARNHAVSERERVSASAPVFAGWQSWAASSGTVALRNCESGDTYTENTGNGYYGAYQFSESTWLANGGSGLPSNAPAWEQDEIAYRLYQERGSSPWPICGRYL